MDSAHPLALPRGPEAGPQIKVPTDSTKVRSIVPAGNESRGEDPTASPAQSDDPTNGSFMDPRGETPAARCCCRLLDMLATAHRLEWSQTPRTVLTHSAPRMESFAFPHFRAARSPGGSGVRRCGGSIRRAVEGFGSVARPSISAQKWVLRAALHLFHQRPSSAHLG